jgi:hypothetical protein
MGQNHQETLTAEDISKIIEHLIRRVVRGQLRRITQKRPGMFYLDPDMPLYADMQDLKKRKTQGKIEFY